MKQVVQPSGGGDIAVVLAKAKTDGIRATVQAVRTQLADDLALGYSGAGTVIEIGAATQGFRLGDRVATAGGGYASHTEIQSVPWLLAEAIPDGVSDEPASFATVASVGLHGLRLADMRIGSKIVAVGMGLIGQMAARMAAGAGCDVFGVDLDERLLTLAAAHGIAGSVESGSSTTASITEWSRGRGADAVIITAGAHGDSLIIQSVPAHCGDRATVVAVGDVGPDLDRNSFYYKEFDLKVARSYGPSRYDRTYEEWGVDYPIGHVRWTEGQNLEAVLDLMKSGRLDVDDLITHRYPIADARMAYAALDRPAERPIGIVLTYDGAVDRSAMIEVPGAKQPSRRSGRPNVGIIGVGNFVRAVVVAALAASHAGPIVHVASSSGVSATRFAERHGVARASSDAAAVIPDPDVGVVAIATPHSTHAGLTVAALDAGKDVYCEKPLALDRDELTAVESALDASSGRHVGYTRRCSPMLIAARHALSGAGPVQIEYRVNAGALAAEHWYSDPREGGRLLGEVRHFIDSCAFLVGDSPAGSVHALAPADASHDAYRLLIGYDDGSSASIVYSDASHFLTPKERIEINGRGHTVVLDNYRSLTVDGSRIKVSEGKGHTDGIAAFIAGELVDSASTAVQTTRVALDAIEDLLVS